MKNIFLSIVLGFIALSLTGCATTPPASDQAPAETTGATEPAEAATEPTPAPEPAVDGETPEDRVARRGRERWDYLFSQDYGEAYNYLSPAYRDKLTRNEYIIKMASQRIRWNAADFREVECEPDLCQARWIVTWLYPVPVRGVGTYEGEKRLIERWILSDGEWYFVPSA